MVNIDRVSKTYSTGTMKIDALKDISISLSQGIFYALVGRSGSGKSTLLHLIGGLDTPTFGKIYFNGRNISDMGNREMAIYRSSTIGFIFQEFLLEYELSCADNVLLALIAAGCPKTKRKCRCLEVLGKVGLQEKYYHPAGKLSGGEKQRLAIARALVNNPDVILADEPTGNLDTENGRVIIDLLREIAKMGKIVIMVTHNHEDAGKADVSIELRDGQILRVEENLSAG